jgi:chromosome segregation ATPase
VNKVLAACNAAADELAASRTLIGALEEENGSLRSRLATEKQTTGMLNELNEARKAETTALRETVAAKNEAIAAKDQVIASQEKLIATLNKRKASIWKRVGDLAIGAAVGLILK